MEQKELNFTNVERYWFDCVLNARLPQDLGSIQTWSENSETWVQVGTFVRDYLSSPYMQHAHEHAKRAAETELGIALAKLIPSRRVKRERISDGKRPNFWILPDLKRAQSEFDQVLGAPYPWTMPEVPKK
jgi:hypothetical protein